MKKKKPTCYRIVAVEQGAKIHAAVVAGACAGVIGNRRTPSASGDDVSGDTYTGRYWHRHRHGQA